MIEDIDKEIQSVCIECMLPDFEQRPSCRELALTDLAINAIREASEDMIDKLN
jgi:hypothetical protein